MLVYVVYFIFLAVLAIQYEFTPFHNKYLLIAIVVLLAFLAGFQDTSVSRDYGQYQYLFDSMYEITDHNLFFLVTFEPGFVAIVLFFREIFTVNYAVAIMLFYAITSVSLKVYTINRLSINPYLTLLFYFSYFFLIHEMTQIRIALASGIFLISLIPYLKGKKGTFALLILLAGCFHYSAFFYLLLLFFNTRSLNRWVYLGVLVVSLALGFIKLPVLNLLGNIDIMNVSGKLYNYVEISKNGTVTINVFNSLNLLNILCCFYILFAVNDEHLISDKKLILFLKCNILSIFLLMLLAGAPAFSLRFNELFSLTQIFLYTWLLKYLPAKKYNVFILVAVAGLIFYVTQFYGDLLGPYKIISINKFDC
jgi:EpsG family